MDQVFEVGDEALLTDLLGESIDPPCRVRIVGATPGRGLLEYEVVMPRVKVVETGRTVDDLHVWAMAKWLVPAQIVIQEIPEWPCD
jgi:hypothetical protein